MSKKQYTIHLLGHDIDVKMNMSTIIAYEEITGHVKKIDPVSRILVLTEGNVIPIDRIYGVECLANP